jgi:hypothetical protein
MFHHHKRTEQNDYLAEGREQASFIQLRETCGCNGRNYPHLGLVQILVMFWFTGIRFEVKSGIHKARSARATLRSKYKCLCGLRLFITKCDVFSQQGVTQRLHLYFETILLGCDAATIAFFVHSTDSVKKKLHVTPCPSLTLNISSVISDQCPDEASQLGISR